ncbi:hyaluronidase-like [Strongylocentrotus purpuratus]|uniref:Hyaluronidase n=1 Tax=Strongylocentrotus purpuratus TaxID=7668 RepID=A0A7M7NXA7_STRPU|nr:hyaluronidase-like [Strongylocentrotus purpuratus]
MPGNYFSLVCQLLLIFCLFKSIHCTVKREQVLHNVFNKYLDRNELRENFGRIRSFPPRTYGSEGTRWSADGGDVFRAIWNVPNGCEERHGIEIPLSDYGIEFNKNHSWWTGDVISQFDAQMIGYYPHVTKDGTFINGGIPQLGNITAHLQKVADDILTAISDPDYAGLAMIDWEAWYPQWNSIEQRYRTYSTDHVSRQHPEWDKDTVNTVAALEWTEGAKLFMESTLQLAKLLRPKALWGYYHYPYCMVLANSTQCHPLQPKLNDEILWLFNESTIMYPSIYLIPEHVADFESSVKGRLAEAFRIREKSSDPKGAVMSYTRFNYTSTYYYFTLEDLNHTILTSAEFGTHGIVFWGDNYDDGTLQTCQELRDYVINALGPVVVMAREGAGSCSNKVCSGQGRCVGEILTCGKGDHRQKRKKREVKDSVCTCRCFVGWQGYDCSTRVKY